MDRLIQHKRFIHCQRAHKQSENSTSTLQWAQLHQRAQMKKQCMFSGQADNEYKHFGNQKARCNSWPNRDEKKSWCDTRNTTWNIKEAGDKCQGLFDFSLNNSMDDQIWSWRSSAIMAMQILAHGWAAGELWTLAITLAFHYIPSSHFCFYLSQIFFNVDTNIFRWDFSTPPRVNRVAPIHAWKSWMQTTQISISYTS